MPLRRSPPAAAARRSPIADIARATIMALEAIWRATKLGGPTGLYERDAGEKFAGFFRCAGLPPRQTSPYRATNGPILPKR